MKVTIKGHMVACNFEWMEPGEVSWGFSVCADKPAGKYIVASVPHSFDAEVPDDLNIIAAQIANIEREREEAKRIFSARIRELDAQASKLQALEMAR